MAGETVDLPKILRLKAMLEALRTEVRDLTPDAASIERLARMQNEIEEQLGSAVTDELEVELAEFSSCCRDNPAPTPAEIRVAQAQLIGWIEGLLQGVGLTIAAQRTEQQRLASQAPAAPAERSNPNAYL